MSQISSHGSASVAWVLTAAARARQFKPPTDRLFHDLHLFVCEAAELPDSVPRWNRHEPLRIERAGLQERCPDRRFESSPPWSRSYAERDRSAPDQRHQSSRSRPGADEPSRSCRDRPATLHPVRDTSLGSFSLVVSEAERFGCGCEHIIGHFRVVEMAGHAEQLGEDFALRWLRECPELLDQMFRFGRHVMILPR